MPAPTMTPPARTSRRTRAPSRSARGGRAPSPPRRSAARARRRRRRACAGRRRHGCQHGGLDAPRQRPGVVGRPAGPPGVEPEGDEHVVDAGDRRRTVAQELVGAGRGPVAHRAGHGHHVDRALDRRLGRDQRAATLAALDDDEHLAERGEDAVAQREPERLGRRCPAATPTAAAPRRRPRPTARRAPAGTAGRVRCRPRRPAARRRPRRARRGGRRRRCPWPGRTRRRRRPSASVATELEGGARARPVWRCACRRCRPAARRGRPGRRERTAPPAAPGR